MQIIRTYFIVHLWSILATSKNAAMTVFIVFVDLFNMASSVVGCWTTRCGGVRASHKRSESNYRIRGICVHLDGVSTKVAKGVFPNPINSEYQIPCIPLASHRGSISKMLNAQLFQVVCSRDPDYVSRAVSVLQGRPRHFSCAISD